MRPLSTVLLAAISLGAPASVATPSFAGDAVRTMCVTGVARSDRLNIREYGYGSARKIGAIPSDGCVTVIGVCDAWCNVEYRGVNGFAAQRFLRASAGGGGIADGHGPDSYCVRNVGSGDVLNVRSGPSSRFGKVGALPRDACGIRLSGGCQGNWCSVSWGRISGWVNTRFLGE